MTISLLLTGCPEKRRPAGSATPSAAPSGSSSSQTTTTERAKGPLADYARNLMDSEKKATEVTGLTAIEQAVNQFNVIESRYPKSLDELVAMGYMVKIPPAPRGQRFIYDPSDGSVKALDLPSANDTPQAPAAPALPEPENSAPASEAGQ